jgi:AcrR family transcriptional regulator
VKSRRTENLEATRAALMAVAREHFAREGYSKAEIGRIAAEASVTTGAIYHHFSSKKGLFLAVAESMEQALLAKAASAGAEHLDPWSRLRAAFDHLLEACVAEDVQRILFVEAPQVLGPEAWREIELRYALGAVEGVLAALMDADVLKRYPVDLVARTLLALLREASAQLARSTGDKSARRQINAFVRDVLDALEKPTMGDASSTDAA